MIRNHMTKLNLKPYNSLVQTCAPPPAGSSGLQSLVCIARVAQKHAELLNLLHTWVVGIDGLHPLHAPPRVRAMLHSYYADRMAEAYPMYEREIVRDFAKSSALRAMRGFTGRNKPGHRNTH